MEDYKMVVANLEDFTENGLSEAIMESLTKACNLVEASAKQKCPVDDGQLRQSIAHDIDEEKLIGYVGTNVEYAPYVEIGTGIHSKKGNGRQTPWRYYDEKHHRWITTKGQKPQPFLKPALDENKEEIRELFKGII